jgi:hypothetical protein
MLGFGLDFGSTIKTVAEFHRRNSRNSPLEIHDPYAMDNYVLCRHELLPKLEFE